MGEDRVEHHPSYLSEMHEPHGLEFFLSDYKQLLKQSPLFNINQLRFGQHAQMGLSPEMANSTSSQTSTPEQIPSDEAEVSSPYKRRKAIAKGKKACVPKGRRLDMDCEERVVGSKGSPNKRWDPECSDYAIEVLADLAKQGLKVDKSFKRQAFVNCANAVNEKYNESYTPENVANHLRTLETKWNHISFVRNLSGAGFDNELKMILLVSKPLEDFKLV